MAQDDEKKDEKKEEKKEEKTEEKAEEKKEDAEEKKPSYPIPGIGKKVQSKEEKEAFEAIVKKYPAARYPINQNGNGKEAVEAEKKAAEPETKKEEEKKEEKKEESLLQLEYDGVNPYSKYEGNVGSRSKVYDENSNSSLWDEINWNVDGP